MAGEGRGGEGKGREGEGRRGGRVGWRAPLCEILNTPLANTGPVFSIPEFGIRESLIAGSRWVYEDCGIEIPQS